MHNFPDLVDRCTGFTLEALREANEKTINAMQEKASQGLVVTLQMIQLQKAIFAIGMFSLFEAMLQDALACGDGFREAADTLNREGETVLKAKFYDLLLAINVLKHGRGRSYDELVSRAEHLPFRVKRSGEVLFSEGDVAEVSTLVQVDDEFVANCAEVIREVYAVVQRHPQGPTFDVTRRSHS